MTRFSIIAASVLMIGMLMGFAGLRKIKISYEDGTPVQGILEIVDQAGRTTINNVEGEHQIIDGTVDLRWGFSHRGNGHELLYRVFVGDDEVQSGHFAIERLGSTKVTVKSATIKNAAEQDVDPNA